MDFLIYIRCIDSNDENKSRWISQIMNLSSA